MYLLKSKRKFQGKQVPRRRTTERAGVVPLKKAFEIQTSVNFNYCHNNKRKKNIIKLSYLVRFPLIYTIGIEVWKDKIVLNLLGENPHKIEIFNKSSGKFTIYKNSM